MTLALDKRGGFCRECLFNSLRPKLLDPSMQPDKENNRRLAEPSTKRGEGRPILKDCHNICCPTNDDELEYLRPILFGCRRSCCNLKTYEDGADHNVCYRKGDIKAKKSDLSQDPATGCCK